MQTKRKRKIHQQQKGEESWNSSRIDFVCVYLQSVRPSPSPCANMYGRIKCICRNRFIFSTFLLRIRGPISSIYARSCYNAFQCSFFDRTDIFVFRRTHGLCTTASPRHHSTTTFFNAIFYFIEYAINVNRRLWIYLSQMKNFFSRMKNFVKRQKCSAHATQSVVFKI